MSPVLSVAEAEAKLGSLLHDLAGGRNLPSKIKQRLQLLIEKQDSRIFAAIQTFTLPSQRETLAEAVFMTAIEDMNETWERVCVPAKLAKEYSAAGREVAGTLITLPRHPHLFNQVASSLTASINLVYGEVAFKPMATALCKFANMPAFGSGVFYDLGSGAGRGTLRLCVAIDI